MPAIAGESGRSTSLETILINKGGGKKTYSYSRHFDLDPLKKLLCDTLSEEKKNRQIIDDHYYTPGFLFPLLNKKNGQEYQWL